MFDEFGTRPIIFPKPAIIEPGNLCSLGASFAALIASYGGAPSDVFTCNFGAYTTNEAPGDWTVRPFSSGGSLVIQEDGATIQGKYLTLKGAAIAATWDAISAAADVDVCCVCRFDGSTSSNAAGIAARLQSGPTHLQGIALDTASSGLGSSFNIRSRISGSTTSIGSQNNAFNDAAWHGLRFNLTGTAWKLRWWVYGAPEPGSWNVEVTSSAITAAGLVGALRTSTASAAISDTSFQWFSVGLNGSPAAAPP